MSDKPKRYKVIADCLHGHDKGAVVTTEELGLDEELIQILVKSAILEEVKAPRKPTKPKEAK